MNISNERILKKEKLARPIYSITPFTLLDYPDKTACILWFAGCNMRCLYCYNPDIVLGKGSLDFEKVFQFLESRKGLLDGVVLSGGECTLHKNIIPFIIKIKALGFSVKIDTNGSNPLVIKQLLQQKLIDYLALDFKGLPSSFQHITQSNLFNKFEETLSSLISSDISFEVRTTVHSDLIPEDDFIKMIDYLETMNFSGRYYIQHFINNVPTLTTLGYSNRDLAMKNFSTPNIQIIFRE